MSPLLQELAADGIAVQRYLVGSRYTADSSAWRTEIGWPVFRVAAAGDPTGTITGTDDAGSA